MEYVFLAALVISIWIYMSDRKGWNATAKRISTNIRAHVEAGKPIPALEPAKAHDDWEQQFKEIENPQTVKAPAVPSRHGIIKTDYYETTSYGLWPRWHCKCGVSAYEPRGGRSMAETQRAAKKGSERHIKEAEESDALLAKTNGKFSW